MQQEVTVILSIGSLQPEYFSKYCVVGDDMKLGLLNGGLFSALCLQALALAGCAPSFQQYCARALEDNKRLKFGVIDSVEIDRGGWIKPYNCDHLCFSILYKLQIPIIVNISDAEDPNYAHRNENIDFYSFVKKPGSYEFRFKDTRNCRDRGEKVWLSNESEQGDYINECISVAPAAVYKNTVKLVFDGSYEHEDKGKYLISFKHMRVLPAYVYKGNMKIGTLVNPFHGFSFGSGSKECFNYGPNNKYGFENQIVMLLKQQEMRQK